MRQKRFFACTCLLLLSAVNASRVQYGQAEGAAQIIAAHNKRLLPGRVQDPASVEVKQPKPLVGILTQPCHDCPGKSYIAAGFVKWVEAAGARAVPIRFYASDDELKRIFNSINAIIFPGGLTWLWLDAPYVITARKLFNMAVQANDAGDVFPIHGTCLGFQLLHILASNVSRNDMLVDTDSVAHATTLDWTPAAKNSRMFGNLPEDLYSKLASNESNIALENHMYGIPPPFYKKFKLLDEWYSALSTSKDRNGIEYISTMEGKKYPFSGTQWHPEKPPYEFGMEEVPHSLDAIRVSQHIANNFVQTARLSSHKPESKEEELALLIYSTPVVFSARFEVMDEENYDGPDMTYYFDKQDRPPHGPDDDEGGDDGDDMLGSVDASMLTAEGLAQQAAARKKGAAWWSQVQGMY